jgi:pimeloyl-ACP methyl ester carboxylesterase
MNRQRFCEAATVAAAALPLGFLAPSERSQAMTTIAQAGSDATAIRPFPKVNVPEAELVDLRRRITATRWPTRELVPYDTQGVQLATTQALAEYWANGYDWRTIEAQLNATPQFVTEIDGLDVHFIHVRSPHDNALPLIITHGWPGSIIEQMKVIDLLSNPTAHGASAADAFHLVIPSLPGYGYSAEPAVLGWDPVRIAKAWIVLMQRLGYQQFVAQGGDWGAAVTQQMGVIAGPVLAIHSNMPGTVPDGVLALATSGGNAPAGLSPDELHAFEQLKDFYGKHLGYAIEMSNRPQTLYSLLDSPIGLAAWILDHDKDSYEMIAPAFAGNPGGLSRDDVLDTLRCIG